jgi:hypothetical protein
MIHARKLPVGDQIRLMNSIYLILSAALGPGVFTLPLTEMSTRSRKIMFMGSRELPVRKVDDFLVNVGSVTSHNPIGLHGLFTETALLYGDGMCFL